MVEDNVALAANEKELRPESVRPVSRIPVLFGFFIIAFINRPRVGTRTDSQNAAL
jgi:hypothetical protein